VAEVVALMAYVVYIVAAVGFFGTVSWVILRGRNH